MADEVLITSDVAKLPPAVSSLLDPAVPLPSDVAYFEKQYDLADITRTLLIGAGLGVAGLILIPVGVAFIYHDATHTPTTVYSSVSLAPVGFGLLLAFAAWFMLASLPGRWRLRNRQLRGECTRRGTFITADALIEAGDFDTTVVPAAAFGGLEGGSVKYRHNEVEKSYALPKALINSTVEQRDEAIKAWGGVDSGSLSL